VSAEMFQRLAWEMRGSRSSSPESKSADDEGGSGPTQSSVVFEEGPRMGSFLRSVANSFWRMVHFS